ncbi:hypothetical protein F5878DRAFT_139894 [Lentinula raphanica]|uniref:Uncharacterized protein n=1 Tax=Lentinula raphanica TaxID=153919 RepID=A0AA38PAN5_9AGAR|nr:hypothetical protein F5878DRAFT_139894 [Lentinula raphanica]
MQKSFGQQGFFDRHMRDRSTTIPMPRLALAIFPRRRRRATGLLQTWFIGIGRGSVQMSICNVWTVAASVHVRFGQEYRRVRSITHSGMKNSSQPNPRTPFFFRHRKSQISPSSHPRCCLRLSIARSIRIFSQQTDLRVPNNSPQLGSSEWIRIMVKDLRRSIRETGCLGARTRTDSE